MGNRKGMIGVRLKGVRRKQKKQMIGSHDTTQHKGQKTPNKFCSAEFGVKK